jgi:hypothetical protein
MNGPTLALVGAAAPGLFALLLGLSNIVKDLFTEGEGKSALAAATRAEAAVHKHESWRTDFQINYDILQQRCVACEIRQQATERSLDFLLEEFDDQILPMLPDETRIAARVIMRRAREIRVVGKEDSP